MDSVVLQLFFIISLPLSSSQYYRDSTLLLENNYSKSCSSYAGKIAMLEHFFTLVFNEFESSLPVCLCVQMCSNQPLFCYPNGCLRRDPTYSGNNIRLDFDVATFPPTQPSELAYKVKFDNPPMTLANTKNNAVVKQAEPEKILPVDLQFFDKKFKSLLSLPLPSSGRVTEAPRKDRYTLIRSDSAGRYLTEQEYQAAEDLFNRHIQVSK